MTDLTAFVLAGGKSTRMGTDKAFIEFGGTTLLNRALAIASQLTAEVRIVGCAELFSSYAMTVPDIYAGHGPLAGIHAALRGSGTELNLALAVDTPFVEPDFLRYLVQEAFATDALVTVPFVNGRFQPLCAVYRRGFADLADKALAAGINKIDPLFTQGITRTVPQKEIERLAFPAAMFDNLNTREELERARAQAEHK